MQECDVGDIIEWRTTGKLYEVTGVINDRQIFYYINDLTDSEYPASFDVVSRHWTLCPDLSNCSH